jgi:hypothetical protein
MTLKGRSISVKLSPASDKVPCTCTSLYGEKIDYPSLTAVARQVARQLDPGFAIYDVRTIQDWLDRSLGTRRAYSVALCPVCGRCAVARAI